MGDKRLRTLGSCALPWTALLLKTRKAPSPLSMGSPAHSGQAIHPHQFARTDWKKGERRYQNSFGQTGRSQNFHEAGKGQSLERYSGSWERAGEAPGGFQVPLQRRASENRGCTPSADLEEMSKRKEQEG